jgi:hypothetical protein
LREIKKGWVLPILIEIKMRESVIFPPFLPTKDATSSSTAGFSASVSSVSASGAASGDRFAFDLGFEFLLFFFVFLVLVPFFDIAIDIVDVDVDFVVGMTSSEIPGVIGQSDETAIESELGVEFADMALLLVVVHR